MLSTICTNHTYKFANWDRSPMFAGIVPINSLEKNSLKHVQRSFIEYSSNQSKHVNIQLFACEDKQLTHLSIGISFQCLKEWFLLIYWNTTTWIRIKDNHACYVDHIHIKLNDQTKHVYI